MTQREAREKALENSNREFEIKVEEAIKAVDRAASLGKMRVNFYDEPQHTNSNVIMYLENLGYSIESRFDPVKNSWYIEIKW